MSAVTALLRSARTRFVHSPPYRLLVRLRITGLVKKMYYRRLLSRGHEDLTLAGQRVRLRVRSVREIERLDHFSHEEHLVRRMLDAIRPGDVFYDVGANIGVLTAVIARGFEHEGVHAHAFEPEPRNAAELRDNVSLNSLANVTVHELALGSENGTARLQVGGEVGEGTHSIMADASRSGRDEVEIRIVRASDFVGDEAPPPDVVKIDVEGAELHVLRGLEPLFANGHCRELFIEVHPNILSQNGSSADEVRQLLESHGFSIAWSEGRLDEIQQHYTRSA